jgi:hypothetical protein
MEDFGPVDFWLLIKTILQNKKSQFRNNREAPSLKQYSRRQDKTHEG